MTSLRSLCIALCVFALCGCASVYSTKDAVSDVGLVYYMPKQDIQITVTTAGGKLTQIAAAPTSPYADRSITYALEYRRHPIAKNSLDVVIGPAGLLTSADSSQTGDTSLAFGSLGSIAGFVQSFGVQADAASDVLKLSGECSADGSHTYIVTLPVPSHEKDRPKICGGKVTYKIVPLGWKSTASADKVGPAAMTNQPSKQPIAGLYYRVNLPYHVTLDVADGLHVEHIVLSPSESRDYLLPVAQSFFANTDSKIAFANGTGVPSKYLQNTDGEIAALLKIPATILTTYFAAIGQVFTGFSTNAAGEKTLLESTTAAQLARLKFDACLRAIESKDTVMITNLSCGGK